MKITLILFLIIVALSAESQNINFEFTTLALYRLPLTPLSLDRQTLDVSVQDLGNDLDPQVLSDIENTISIAGFSKEKNPALRLQLILSPLSVAGKELKDSPYTTEKDGVKTVYHNYDYTLNCNFPTRLRLILPGVKIMEQEFPGFFQVRYSGGGARTEIALQKKWESDYHFQHALLLDQLSGKLKQVQDYLDSQYGCGMIPQLVKIAYVKDKHGDYADLNKGMSLVREALLFADNKHGYIRNPHFKSKIEEVNALYRRALAERSRDKKARVNAKVAAMICYNLAVISFVTQDFHEARNYLLKTSEGSNGTQMEAQFLLDKISDYEKRAAANSTLEPKTSN